MFEQLLQNSQATLAAANAAVGKPAAPASQKERQIYFRLVNNELYQNFTGRGHLLSINPEDLTVTEPSRVSVQQTIGNAWVDSFGPGLRTIAISGTTGWRAKHPGGRDWEAEFISLHDEAFTAWHKHRQYNIDNGLDPDKVDLEFVDSLDGIAVCVVPGQFVLKRNKSRPLLMQYTITMQVLSNIADPSAAFALNKPNQPDKAAAEASFLNSIENLTVAAENYAKIINTYATQFEQLLKPIGDFINKANRIMQAVQNSMMAVDRFFTSIVSVAQKIAQAGRNLFVMLSAIQNFPQKLIGYFQQVGSIFTNLLCLFKNGLKNGLMLQNYNDFYGSSNCSSTSGGRPLSPLRNVNGLALLPIT